MDHYKSCLRACSALLTVIMLICGCGKEEYRIYKSTDGQGEETTLPEVVSGENTTEDMTKAGFAEAEYHAENTAAGAAAETGDMAEAETVCYVHICGAVLQPGVYQVKSGSRLYEVIELAGGLNADAADQAVNQAQAVSDGMQIYIPTKDEIQNGERSGSDAYISDPAGAGNGITDAQGLVNINTADLALLCTLPGIGESKARAIITYREEHGAFQSIQELMNVTGIKSGVFEQIKELIKV